MHRGAGIWRKDWFRKHAIQHMMHYHGYAYLYRIFAVQIAAKTSVCICHKSMTGIIGVGVTANLPVSSEASTILSSCSLWQLVWSCF